MASIGSLIVSVEGTELTGEDREIIAHPLVGGIILFSRNYASRAQLQNLCQSIRATRQTPLLIMVDQEGGRVQRFKDEFTRIPPMAFFGHLYDQDPLMAARLAKNCAWLLAAEVLAAGVDLSLAPVLDLNKNNSSVIGDRAFHRDPNAVIQLAKAFIAGMNEAGMAAVGKHFPGHGSVTLDSHLDIPIDNRSLNEIEQDDMIPFVALMNAGMKGIMPAHIIFPQVDPYAVGFSRIWLQKILRKRFGFKGVIFSDDLNMEGANISSNYTDRVMTARAAGCDFALLCNNRNGVIQVLDSLPHANYLVGGEKWGALQGKFPNIEKPLIGSCKWMEIQEFLLNTAQKFTSN